MTTETTEITPIELEKEIAERPAHDEPPKRHVVNPAMNIDFQHKYGYCETPQDIVDIARVRGVAITALCGLKFIPGRNPAGLETCDICMDIMGKIMSEG